MQNSKNHFNIVALILFTINILFVFSWIFLKKKQYDYDSSDKKHKLSLLRNDGYLRDYFQNLKNNKKILWLGTSESTYSHSIPYQLNSINSNNIYQNKSIGWLSPIHLSLLFAKLKKYDLEMPSLVIPINPVYFTNQHDVINEGGIDNIIKSSVFLKMNHNGIMSYLSEDLKSIFSKHYLNNFLLKPFEFQKYTASLLYLNSKQSNHEMNYGYDGAFYDFLKIPEYDNIQNTRMNYRPVDIFNKKNWVINESNISPNLVGIESIISILNDFKSKPVLFLLLPVNLKYYSHIGLDVKRYQNKYEEIRSKIKNMIKSESIFVVDLNEDFKLDKGFLDRMHYDEYGCYQISNYMISSSIYNEFIYETVNYYQNGN